MVNRTFAAIIAIVIIVVVVVGAATFALLQNENDRKTGNDTDSGELQATVTIENGTFNPSNLTVKQGTTVKWIVKDESVKEQTDTYMVTSKASGSVEGKYLFMSDYLYNGQSYTYKFDKPGTYEYYDMNHMDDEKLMGTITVE